MKINWISSAKVPSEKAHKFLDSEYRFRKRITSLLQEKLDSDDTDDLDAVEFDYYTDIDSFKISKRTPEPLYSFLKKALC
jgi:hypothetical protein